MYIGTIDFTETALGTLTRSRNNVAKPFKTPVTDRLLLAKRTD